MDRDADLNTPATTPSGCVDGMVVSHLTGRGAAELVRFWGEPPLVREPDLALFGVDRLDPSEEEVLRRSPMRRYLADDVKRMGASAAARTAIERVHGNGYQFILHFDVDVIADFQATNYPGSGGLTLEDVRAALEVFLQQKHLAAIEVTAFNPTKDSDGSAAKIIVELLVNALEKRLESAEAPAETSVAAAEDSTKEAASGPSPESAAKADAGTIETSPPPVHAGDEWSSDAPGEETAVSTNESALTEESGEPGASAGGREESPKSPESKNEAHETREESPQTSANGQLEEESSADSEKRSA